MCVLAFLSRNFIYKIELKLKKMITEHLKSEILTLCQNVICGSKLAAEFSFVHRLNEDYDQIIETIKHFPELKYHFVTMPENAAKYGWRNCYIYKYERVINLIHEIEQIEDKNSVIYHFALGKLFGYNDFEVMKFIKDKCKSYYVGCIY